MAISCSIDGSALIKSKYFCCVQYKIFNKEYSHIRTIIMQDGVWIKGLFLEGAGWDKRTSCLMDSRAMELVCAMPTIHFRPVEGKRRSTKGRLDTCVIIL